jgi:hypothetical protein
MFVHLQALHTFLKTDPRLPPLATDTVTAASGPEAAAAAAAAQAGYQQQQQQQQGSDAAEEAKKALDVPNIIRVTFHPAAGGPRKGGKDARGKNRKHPHTQHCTSLILGSVCHT